MARYAFKKIPIVDIEPLLCYGADISKKAVQQCVTELHRSSRDVGFVSITSHRVSKELQKDVLYKILEFSKKIYSRQFFALPLEEKMEIHIAKYKDGKRGYQRLGQNVTQDGKKPLCTTNQKKKKKDIHEGFDLLRPTNDPKHWPLNTPNLWPTNPADYKEVMEEYVKTMSQLGHLLMRGMALGLRLSPDFFNSFMNESFWIMRSIHYPVGLNQNLNSNHSTQPSQPSSVDNDYPWGIGCGEHRDYGCLTMIIQDEVYGNECLQLRNRNNEWITANTNDERGQQCLVINIGDMLHYWSHGFYQSTPHRVLNPKPVPTFSLSDKLYHNTGRVSVPFFFEPNWDALVQPIDFSSQQHADPYTLKFLPWDDIDTQFIGRTHPFQTNAKSFDVIGSYDYFDGRPVLFGDHLKKNFWPISCINCPLSPFLLFFLNCLLFMSFFIYIFAEARYKSTKIL
ncbi:hypothetical protein RFI_07469 [Reticulomyxa filosa]|uniref:Fe2OG dioxygenase domain-containing protein n=1 Tax=Reticulomyxa filosa TaxID=46433 RepID=X6NUR7_RETFI|nr:hypothetical protein RFI_07469 [Reticulomyxa filosa]|eukprot:ETO29648.1 hypothetical protein RFI_07469 [Reticulomyxa filosa]